MSTCCVTCGSRSSTTPTAARAGRGCRSSPSCAPTRSRPSRRARDARRRDRRRAGGKHRAPDWIATADLTLHLVGGAPPGSVVEARALGLRAGRTTVVIEVGLTTDLDDGPARELGIATMSFSVLPRRDTNPDMTAIRGAGPSTMATERARLAARCSTRSGYRYRRPGRRDRGPGHGLEPQLHGRDAGRRRRDGRRPRPRRRCAPRPASRWSSPTSRSRTSASAASARCAPARRCCTQAPRFGRRPIEVVDRGAETG